MLDYRRQGQLPKKPHTVFRGPDGALRYEQCFTRVGFDGPFSILYHQNPPHFHHDGAHVSPLWAAREELPGGPDYPLRRRHFKTPEVAGGNTPHTGRTPLLFNADLTVGLVRPEVSGERYLANGDGDDLFFIHRGGGVLLTWFGELRFQQGDYLCVPRSVPYRFQLDEAEQYWLWMECRSGVRVPTQYRNPVGQLRMDAPYTHRDFETPILTSSPERDGPRAIISKRRDRFTIHRYDAPIRDVVGWDGTVYPWRFPILNFSPKAGQVHLPPTVHGTFATDGSLICSFVPRVVDFGDGAIPCPYPHSNVDVDEIIFYCDGDFTSRRGVEEGSISFHPAGVPHGPHPGAYEGSVGVREVHETAVMIDTFEPLRMTVGAEAIEAIPYDESWVDEPSEGE